MSSKQCKQCGETKALEGFTPQKKGYLGRTARCKVCLALNGKESRSDRTREVERNSKRRNYNSEKETEYKRKQYWENPDKFRKRSREFYYKKPEVYKENARLRDKRRKEATPPWLTKDQKQTILRIYWWSKELSKGSTTYNVDHIVPLQGEEICGLHVPWNLQILTETENKSKGNSYAEV